METKTATTNAPWLIILTVILVIIKYTIAPALSWWVVFIPLLIPAVIFIGTIVFLLIVGLIGAIISISS